MIAFVTGRRPWLRAMVAVSAIVIGGTWFAVGGTTAAGATTVTLATFNTRGKYTWTVPSSVTKITFTVYGASGGNVVEILPGPTIVLVAVGGTGGEAMGTFKVKPGQTFEIVVGGGGYNNQGQTDGQGGFNGGGFGTTAPPGDLGGAGGGGASDVRIGGAGNSCASGQSCNEFDRIIVGGGGGGAAQGSYGQGNDGGAGGGVSGGCADSTPCTGKQEGSQCTFNIYHEAASGCFGFGGTGSSGSGVGGGGGGWFGGNHGYEVDTLAGGGGGSGYIGGLALKSSFPGGTRRGDGLVFITTP